MLGSIMLFAGNFAPKGFALCQGQLLSIAQNTALFSILGTTYGGDGRVTFALPDLRGRAPVQQGQGPGLSPISLGEVSGVQSVTLLQTNLPPHTHLLNENSGAQDAAAPDPTTVRSGFGDPGSPYPAYCTAPPNTVLSPMSIGIAGSNVPLSVQNPFTGLNYIIALQGFFPSRN
jgi:microcystin-dependent protein